jgi:hypothetical protein
MIAAGNSEHIVLHSYFPSGVGQSFLSDPDCRDVALGPRAFFEDVSTNNDIASIWDVNQVACRSLVTVRNTAVYDLGPKCPRFYIVTLDRIRER